MSQDPYYFRPRDEDRELLRAGVVAAVVITLLLAWVLAVEAFGLSVWAPWATNRQTEVTRNTNQYVTTQQEKIYGLVRQYDKLENYEQTAEIDQQQSNLVEQMCDAALKLDDQYVPEQAQPLMTQEGCWQ